MDAYNSFSYSVSKLPLIKLKEIIPIDHVGLRLNENGSNLERIIQMCTNLRSLSNNLLDKLPLAVNGPQIEIGYIYDKLRLLNPLLEQNIKKYEQLYPTFQCISHFNQIVESLNDIDQYILHLTTNQSSSINRFHDGLTSSITSVSDLYNTIILTAKKCEDELRPNISPIDENKGQIFHQIAASLTTFDELLIQLYFFSSNSFVQKSDGYQKLKEWIEKGKKLHQNLFDMSRSDEHQIVTVSFEFFSELSNLTDIISKIQVPINNSIDFSNVSSSITSLNQILNEIESSIIIKDVQYIIENLPQLFLSNKPFENLITTANGIIEKVGIQIKNDVFLSSSKSISFAYSSLSKCIEKCTTENSLDYESTALCISAVVRLAARVFPNSSQGEEILVSLSKNLAKITKSIFKECRQMVLKVNSIINSNLEFVNESSLCETNYFLTAAKNIEDFDLNSDEFVSNQLQLFFVSFCALPNSLTKLANSCLNEEAKKKMNDSIESIQNIGYRFSRWLNQFWLTVFSVIHIRSEMIVGILSFPISLFLSTEQKQRELKEIESILSKIKKIVQTTPQVILGDIEDVNSLINHIFELSKSGDCYFDCVQSSAQSALFPLFKQSTEALSEILADLPQYALPLPLIGNMDNVEIFVCSLLAFINCSLHFAKACEPLMNDEADPSLYHFISPSFMYFCFADYFIGKYDQVSVLLPPLGASVHVSMDNIISKLAEISLGQVNEKKKTTPLSTSFPVYVRNCESLLKAISQLKQPSLAFDIPDDVQELKRFDSMISSLHSSSLKSFAKFILSVTKDSRSSDVKSILNEWLDATQIGVVSLSKSSAKIKSEISNILSNSKNDRSSFIKHFASFSVTLATNEGIHNKSVSSTVFDLHHKFVSDVIEFLELNSDEQKLKEKLMRIYGSVTEIVSIVSISKLKENEKNNFLASVLKRLIISLNFLRHKSDAYQTDEILNAVDPTEELLAFTKVDPSWGDFDLNDLLDKTVSGEAKSDTLDRYISTFSEKLFPLNPSQFDMLESINDNDTICDSLYDKAEFFGENVNNIFQLAKNQEESSNLKISSSLNLMILSASDASLLVMHSITLNGLQNTSLCASFVACCSELFIAIRKFTDTALSIGTKAGSDVLVDLRRINRKMSSQFDIFISIVEEPKKDTSDMTEYDLKKGRLYSNLASVVFHVNCVISLSATSIVPEMYVSKRKEITDKTATLLPPLLSSTDDVLKESVGTSKEDFENLVKKLVKEAESFFESSENLLFGSFLVPLPLIRQCESFSLDAHKVATEGQLLTDKIVIQPDPVAAKKVPDDVILPPFPKEAPKATECCSLLLKAKGKVDSSLASFKTSIENEASMPDELLGAVIGLREASDDFIEKSILMAVSTVNPLYQVEQQTSLHGFVNSLNSVQSALKSRLMRTKSFKTQMDDALASYESSLATIMGHAESASKDSDANADDNEDLDEVTREFNATAAVIEMMSAKLKEFEGQVNMDVINKGTGNVDVFDETAASKIEDIQAAADSLPAYLIAAAEPILATTTKILIRAKEVTSWLLKKFGKIENERGLINTAQNLSEAAELLLVCAEILVSGNDKSAEFKAITAARIINAAVTDLHCQLLKKGGDDEGVIVKHINTVKKYSNSIVLRGEAIVAEKLNQAYEKRPKKFNAFLRQLEQDKVVSDLRAKLETEEKLLKEFRYQQHRIYHSPIKEKKA